MISALIYTTMRLIHQQTVLNVHTGSLSGFDSGV